MTQYADVENTGAPLVPLLTDRTGRGDGTGELTAGEVVWRLDTE
ncbi:hypothetical protein [Halorientalis sp. IM1011]|nr:hypothetical protein [Halorientalis sp. IM1011]